DAIEEAMVIELQDHLTAADGGAVDVKFVVGQLIKLRTSISMREDARRKQVDLERRLRETEAKLSLAEQQERLRAEQVAKLQREKAAWEAKQAAAQEIVTDETLSEEEQGRRMKRLFGMGA